MWIVELNKDNLYPIPIGYYDNKEDAEYYSSIQEQYIRQDWSIKIYEINQEKYDVFYTLLPENTNEDIIMEYLNPNKNYSVIMRTRYSSTDKWYYSNELCTTKIMEGILWLNDWDEGQQYVDFIAFAEINGGD